MKRTKEEIIAYIESRFTLGEQTLKSITLDQDGRPYIVRSAYLIIEKYLSAYMRGRIEPRWIAIPGLRGVGKTTLLAQLYNKIDCAPKHKIYISLDDVKRNLDVGIGEVLDVYQEIIGSPFESLTKNVYLFIDEVQYDDDWGIALKTIYDRSRRVFITCTGSSALSLQTNPDIARRMVMEKLFPVNFVEFQLIKNRKYPIRGLALQLRNALYQSESGLEVYTRLKQLENSVSEYWSDIRESDVDVYLKYGTLPTALSQPNEALIYTQINQTLNNIINRDVPQLNRFDKSTLDRLSQILYSVASYDVTSFNNISQSLGIDIRTVSAIFDAFEKTELLVRLYPYGTHDLQVKKPSKFLFYSPAFRAMYYNLVGSTVAFDNYKGKLFEDIVGFYLTKTFNSKPGVSLTYDTAENGADFILGLGPKRKIAIEASLGNKGFDQLEKTLNKIQGVYGLNITSNPLTLDQSEKYVSVPYGYFLIS